jgi:Flp pilus assembly protein TadG
MGGRARHGAAAGRGHDTGVVTAETALALPAVVAMIAVVLTVGQVVTAQLRCVDAARAGARLAARGEPAERVVSAAARAAPASSRVTMQRSADQATVRVQTMVRLSLPWRPTVAVGAAATGDLESAL